MKNKYLIGEVCKLFNTTRDTLRHYENIGLVNPRKDLGNGYRYYDVEDLNSLTDIFFFKKLNLPLEDIKKAVKNSTPEDILEIINHKEKHLQRELNKIKELEKTLNFMKLNVESCIKNLNKLELKETVDNFLFIEIADNSKFDDFIDIIEGMIDLLEGKDYVNNILHYINFAFLLEDNYLVDYDIYKNIKWGVTLKKSYSFLQDIMIHNKIKVIPQNKYLYTVITLDVEKYEDWLQQIKNIIEENNIKVAGSILGRMLLTEYHDQNAIDYYEIFIPVK